MHILWSHVRKAKPGRSYIMELNKSETDWLGYYLVRNQNFIIVSSELCYGLNSYFKKLRKANSFRKKLLISIHLLEIHFRGNIAIYPLNK